MPQGMGEFLTEAFGRLHTRRNMYRFTFEPSQPANLAVLADLARFCRANETTFHADERIANMLAGRREVWLRIANHLNLTTEQLYQIYNAPVGGKHV